MEVLAGPKPDLAPLAWDPARPLLRITQEGCGSLGGDNPAAFPKARPIFQQAFSLPESAQTLAGTAFRAAGILGENSPAASKFAGKPFQQGISDSHSPVLLFLGLLAKNQGKPSKKHQGFL